MSDHPLARPIQFCGGIVLVLAVLASVAIALDRGQLPARITEHVIPAAIILGAGTAFCGILLGLSGLLEADRTDPVTKRLLTEIRDHLARSSIPVADAASVPSTPASPAQDMAQMLRLLEEIRDISLLDDAGRRDRLQRLMASRRQVAIGTIESLLRDGKWLEADAAIEQTTSLFADAPELDALRQRVASGLAAAEQQGFAQLQKRVLELQAVDNWDQAIAASDEFLRRFPQSMAGLEYHANLMHSRDANIDAIANKLFEEIRADIEQRSWRRALGSSQRLLARCPNHPRTQWIQSQMDVIRQNADTEQRNSMEARIHELVKSGRLKEAIGVGEDLIRAYPLSPQAEIASQLVLKIRDRLEQQSPHIA